MLDDILNYFEILFLAWKHQGFAVYICNIAMGIIS